MCWAMYLFTNNEIQEIEWDNNDPKLFIEDVINNKNIHEEKYYVLKWNENNKNVYYVGSSHGCGCGWQLPITFYLTKIDDDDRKELDGSIKDRTDLYNLLKNYDLNKSYIIICWEGDQGKELKCENNITIENIKDINYNFEELIKYNFV